MLDSKINELKQKITKAGQEHILKYWNVLTEDQQQEYLSQLNSIDFDEVDRLYQRAIMYLNENTSNFDSLISPVPKSVLESEETCDEHIKQQYRGVGLTEISNGHVGVILLAGGQGTRLGVKYPKGLFSPDLPSGKTLLQLQAERIRKLQSLAKEHTGRSGTIPWYIMTSEFTGDVTEEFLKKHEHFGLNPSDVVLFQQGVLPCFDMNGKIILQSKNKIALAPDGNGGLYRALHKNHIFNDMFARGIKYVHVYCVDNILVKVADPVFIGYCVSKESDCAAKVVKKSIPSERVGVICKVNDKYQVVEYSEISEQTSNARDSDSNLLYSAGSICNHFFSLKFLQDVAIQNEKDLKLHVVKKTIPIISSDSHNNRLEEKTTMGIKIEKFVFDVFPLANNFLIWEVPRTSEFSALKNCNETNKECPLTARRDLLALHKRYIENAGGLVKCDVEISPLLSYAGENLEKIAKDKIFDTPQVLYADEEKLDKN